MRYPHSYPGITAEGEFLFTSDCICGCWMGSTRSGGPDGVDPFGACPEHPDRAADAERGEPDYYKYPMPHRPVHEHQERIRAEAWRRIEAVLGEGI